MTPGENIRVLLIEDTPSDAEWVLACLDLAQRESFEVRHAKRLGDGLEILENEEFDIILLDLCLPDSAGRPTFTRACAAARDIPIILMTGLDDEKMAQDALREGVQDYLLKSRIDADLLLRSIRYALERKHSLKALEESRERYALAVQGANDGIWDWDLRKDRIYYSPRWKEMLGYRDDEIGDSPDEWLDRIHPDDRQRVTNLIQAHREGGTTHLECEFLIERKDGSYMWVLCRGLALINGGGRRSRMAGSLSDISERKAAELKLQHDAQHDALTGLANRALIMDLLERAVERTRSEQGYEFALLFLDLDRFKVVNDSLGHVIGDQLLMGLGRRLESLVRPEDTVARLGGDEFVILLDGVASPERAADVADRIQMELRSPFHLEGYDVVATASIGIAMSQAGYERAEEILRDADIAMYRAKDRGRARSEFFDPQMHHSAMSLLRLETKLRQALDHEEFLLHYQPIVSLETCRLNGFEALVRWNHPELGTVLPQEFIPIAEETGLIVEIGRWVLRESCRQMSAWIEDFPAVAELFVSVNLASPQLRFADFAEEIEGLLAETGLQPENLKLEITERIVLEPEPNVMENLRKLRKTGIQLQVDDFGMGYSSLSYLQGYPVDRLKIDRAFIQHMADNVDSLEIVRTIASLATNLRLKVTAEGVETMEQWNQLKMLKVGEGQGFYFSKPLTSTAAGQWLLSKAAALRN